MRSSSQDKPSSIRIDDNTAGPAALWLGVGFLLTGIGTAFLGPILPALAHTWHITDQQSGLLIAAKFIGACLGGLTVRRLLRSSILAGHLLAGLGFIAFALSQSLAPSFGSGIALGTAGLFVSGYGVGLSITATNILIGRRYLRHTGSALATLNFFWSLGAVATGFLAAWIVPRFALRGPALVFAALFLITALAGLLLTTHRHGPDAAPDAIADTAPSTAAVPLAPRVLLYFAALLVLYGGLETCMTGWLTTYSLRLAGAHLLGGQSAVVLLWSALTVGRALASVAMRYLRESTAQRIGLALSALLVLAIANTHSPGLLAVDCILLGLTLAPFFPSTFAILMRRRPTSRQAGVVLAGSGLGAAIFPWMMGFISTHSGSLRIAMAVPLLLALSLLALSLTRIPDSQST